MAKSVPRKERNERSVRHACGDSQAERRAGDKRIACASILVKTQQEIKRGEEREERVRLAPELLSVHPRRRRQTKEQCGNETDAARIFQPPRGEKNEGAGDRDYDGAGEQCSLREPEIRKRQRERINRHGKERCAV